MTLDSGAISRRAAMKTALKAGVYVSPVAIAVALPGVVSAQTLITGGPRPADLAITKTANPTAFIDNATVTFTITVTNNGPGIATGVVVNDQLPTGLTFVSAIPSQGTYTASSGVWTVGTLANGASATLAIVVRPINGLPFNSFLTNTATVTSTSTDPNPANNSASATVQIKFLASTGVVSAAITQQPTAATCMGSATPQYTETFALHLAYDEPNEALDIYISPNNVSPAGVFTKLGTVTTDLQGAATFMGTATVTTQGMTAPTSITFNVVAQGGSPQTPLSSKSYPVTVNRPCGAA